MRKITVEPCSKIIELGRYGENEATAVYLPLAEFEKFTPGGTSSVLVRRPDVTEPSPVSFTVEGGYAIWVVGEDQLAVEGYGEVELRYVIGETRALSRVWSTHIGKSLLPVGDTPPDPFESWYEDIIEASEEAQEAAGNAATSARNASLSESAAAESERLAGLSKDAADQSAQNAGLSELAAQGYAEDAEKAKEAIEDMTVSSETLEAGSEATVEKSIVEGVVNLKFGIPKGKDAKNEISRDTQTDLNGILRGNGTNVDIQAVDSTPTENSNNLVSSGGVAEALQGKQDTLTFDSEPTSGSQNPVTSDGVFNGILKVLPTATASGSTASFDDGADDVPVKSLEANIEPVQDLHGYDAPWPAGGGVNQYNAEAISQRTSNGITITVNDGTITFNGTATAAAFFGMNNGGLPRGNYIFSFNNPVANSGVHVSFRNAGGEYFNDTPTDIVNKTTVLRDKEPKDILLYVSSGVTLTNFVVKPQLEEGSTATSYVPYSNICPISGWTGAKVNATGKNICMDTGYRQGVFGWNVEKPVNLYENGHYISSPFIEVAGGETITITSHGWIVRYYELDEYGNSIFFTGTPLKDSSMTRTLPNNCKYIIFSIGDDNNYYTPSDYGTALYCQIEYGDTATPYEPFGTTYPITFPSEAGTIYGGTLDVTNGVLTVDRAMVDLGTLTWTYNVDRWVGSKPSDIKNNSNLVSDRYPSWTDIGHNGILMNSSYNLWCINGSTTEKPTGQLIYELVTPIVYHLTPTEVTTLLGQNNIWADTGDVTVTYRQDIGLALNKLNNAILSLGGNI